jgi:excisionase family DNA binding protein
MSKQSTEKLAYSVAEACVALSIGRTNLYAIIASGQLESVKIGKRTLIPAASLRALVEVPKLAA